MDSENKKVIFQEDGLIKEGLRYNIPNPKRQIGPTCWYATTYNMLQCYLEETTFDELVADHKDLNIEERVSGSIPDRLTLIQDLFTEGKQVPFDLVQIGGKKISDHSHDNLITMIKAVLEKGPFYVALKTHPSTENSSIWDSGCYGSPTGEGANDVKFRIPYEIGGSPHAMLVVGYVIRDAEKLFGRGKFVMGKSRKYI